jgi:hypothetical protein
MAKMLTAWLVSSRAVKVLDTLNNIQALLMQVWRRSIKF